MSRIKQPRSKRLKSFAISLFILPAALFPIVLLPLFRDPSLVIEGWDMYAMLFGVPWVVAAFTWRYAKALERRGQ
jgi:hypothetical protein